MDKKVTFYTFPRSGAAESADSTFPVGMGDSARKTSIQPRNSSKTNGYEHAVPMYVREKLAKQSSSGKQLSKNDRKPILGFTAYVGSPVNGEMVIGNPLIVDEWLTYIRNAQRRKVVSLSEGVLKMGELNKLVNLNILPGVRHEFKLSYEVHPGLKCPEHRHDRRIWESIAYPSHIVSCECPSSNE